jgi:hypothetical protein
MTAFDLQFWGAGLGIVIILACVGLIIFVISGGLRRPMPGYSGHKKIECWVNVYATWTSVYATKKLAKKAAKRTPTKPLRIAVHLREV